MVLRMLSLRASPKNENIKQPHLKRKMRHEVRTAHDNIGPGGHEPQRNIRRLVQDLAQQCSARHALDLRLHQIRQRRKQASADRYNA